MPANEHKFSNREQMLDALYTLLTAELTQALADQAPATLLLSGGSTPAPLYRRLANAPLDWSRIDVALVDERWVDADDAASNERLLRETLLQGAAAAARFTGMKTGQPTAAEAVDDCNRRYAALPSPYCLCLLGMGADGHTASLFPGAQGLEAALDSRRYCEAIRALPSAVTGDNLERMTLTPWGIRQARKLVLLINGEEKWRIYREACRVGASQTLPVSLFLDQQRVPVEVYWAP
jgi:6-phosphogluconolactonase